MITTTILCDECSEELQGDLVLSKYRLNLTETAVMENPVAVREGYQNHLNRDYHFCSGGCLRNWAATYFSP